MRARVCICRGALTPCAAVAALLILSATGCSESVGPKAVVTTVTLGGVPGDGVLVVRDTLKLSASANDASGRQLSDRSVVWSSSNGAVASVSAGGVVIGIAAGSATIRATSDGVFATASLSIREAVVPPPASALEPTVRTVLDGRVTMSVPPGAVPVGVPRITVGPSSGVPASDELIGGTAFDFGPSGTPLSTPMLLTIRFDPSGLINEDRAGLAIYRIVGGDYEEMYGSVVDSAANEVSAPISSLSSYAILRRAAPVLVTLAAGSDQQAEVGTAVPVRPTVRVLDKRGRPVRFALVRFGIVAGEGSLTGATQFTDSAGIATVGSWTLGPIVGTNKLAAAVNGLPSVTFTATGVAATATQLVITKQPVSATAGTTVTAVVTARDANNNLATTFSQRLLAQLPH